MYRRFKQFIRDSKAVSALEYAILVGVIAVAVGTALFSFGGDITAAMDVIGDKVKAPTGATAPVLNN